MDFAWIHYGMHIVAPLVVAYLYDKDQVFRSYIILMLTMLIDVDHLMATPIFEANRCSINFHPLHQYWAIGIYIILLIPKQTRLVAIGLCFHILTDYLDCYF